ncbi:hypothetical protein HZ326_27521 [Fusarium oxysporum f. sp. albedinis]|nr:hypothetical protein HZ326_27521 [Fusarium oxysporum f. sp. albedinis]
MIWPNLLYHRAIRLRLHHHDAFIAHARQNWMLDTEVASITEMTPDVRSVDSISAKSSLILSERLGYDENDKKG